MPRYLFHIRDGKHLILDEEGIDLQDLETARREATESIRDVVAERIKHRHPTVGLRIEVLDEAGAVVHSATTVDLLRHLITSEDSST